MSIGGFTKSLKKCKKQTSRQNW